MFNLSNISKIQTNLINRKTWPNTYMAYMSCRLFASLYHIYLNRNHKKRNENPKKMFFWLFFHLKNRLASIHQIMTSFVLLDWVDVVPSCICLWSPFFYHLNSLICLNWRTPLNASGTGQDRSIKEKKNRFGNVADVNQTSVNGRFINNSRCKSPSCCAAIVLLGTGCTIDFGLPHIVKMIICSAMQPIIGSSIEKPEKNLIPISVTTTTTTVKELQSLEGWKQRLIKTENPIHALYPKKSPPPHFPDDKTLFQIETKIFDLFPRVDSNLQ